MASGRLARLRDEIRRTPLFDVAVPIEAAVGMPLPRMDAGRVCVALPVHGVAPGPAEAIIFPPLALVTVPWTDPSTGPVPPRIAEYRDLRWSPVVPAGDPDAAIGSHPAGEEDVAAMTECLGLVESMLDGLGAGHDLGPGQVARLQAVFPAAIPPALVPHYRALAPRFTDRFLGPAGAG